MSSITFCGQTFALEADFRREFPAYSAYAHLIRKGADTAHKVECALFRGAKRQHHKSKALAVSKKQGRSA